METLRRLLDTTRLLTLTGAGGSGKTRLAQELASGLGDRFEGGVAWVELAPLDDPALVGQQVAEVLQVRPRPGEPPSGAIAGVVGGRALLLVLDNCEHVIEAATRLAETLLRSCPRLVILATSREALALGGETAWLVPPLSVPSSSDPRGAQALFDGSEAVRLFVDRATAVLSTFELTDANAAAVAAICRRLDGIPLALELAAARLRTLGLDQLLTRLDDRFRILTTGARTALPRHRTLRAAIDWSYDTLLEEERRLLDRLSVFSGTFALEAVEDVCAGHGLAREDILDLLAGLVEKSLVEASEHGSAVRYRLLETVRHYAAERLAAYQGAPDPGRAHADFFSTLVASAEPHLTAPERRVWIERLTEDIDNVRQALGWTRSADPLLHLRLAGMLCWYWFATEHWSEGRQWLHGALTLPQAAEPSLARARALFADGVLSSLQGRSASARPLLEEALATAEANGDARLAAYARNYLGLALASEGNPEATMHLEAALAYMRGANDLYGARLALLLLGTAAAAGGDLDRAVRLTEEGVDAAREFGQGRELGIALRQLAIVEIRRGNAAKAAACAREAVEALQRDPQHYFVAISLEALAVALVDLGRPLEAARLFGAGERIREMIGVAVLKIDAELYAARIEAVRTGEGGREGGSAWDEGRALGVAGAIAFAVGLDRLPTVPAPRAVPEGEGSARREAPTPEAPSFDLVVLALGPLEIRVDGEPLPAAAWSHAKPRELLLYLLAHPGGRTREQIGLTFWRDSAPAQVKNSFHVALHHLRKALGHPEWIRFEGDRYGLAEEVRCYFDAGVFEEEMGRRLRRGRESPPAEELETVLTLYRGDFLGEETVGDWHLEHRDHLRRLYVDGMLALGKAKLRIEEPGEAVEIFRRVVLLDDLHEEAHRHLMVGHARSGDRMAAIRQYERLAALLKDELSAVPEEETVALHQGLLRGDPV